MKFQVKTILCATDFSPNGENAMQYCLEFANKINARVILLHVYESAVVLTETPVPAVFAAESEMRKVDERELLSVKEKAHDKFPLLDIETIVEEGTAYSHIIDNATDYKADLIIMGATTAGKFERLITGSTTSQVIQRANCPVLEIPAKAKYQDIKKIAFATDLREDNIAAAHSLVSFARKFDAEIIFVFVDDKHLLHSNDDIQEMAQKIKSKINYPKISGYVCNDSHIAEGIEYFLEHHSADMLAMFSHKKKFPENIFHSSVTKAMADKTTLPLLVIERVEEEQ